jgi:hypothetical protein
VLQARVHAGLRVLALSGLLAAAAPAPLSAEWQIAPFIGWTFQGDTSIVDLGGGQDEVHWTFGGTATVIGAGPLGAEALFVYTPGFFGKDDQVLKNSRTISLMGNVVLATPRGWNEYGLRPFVSGGIGLLHAGVDDVSDILPVRENILGLNVGGGAVGFITEKAGLRFDLRYFRHLKPVSVEEEAASFGDVRLSYWTGTVGFVFRY